MPDKFLSLMQALYTNTRAVIKYNGNNSREFPVKTGVRQGALTSPIIFNAAIDWVLHHAIKSRNRELSSSGITLSGTDEPTFDLAYADDAALLTSDGPGAQLLLDAVARYSSVVGLKISVPKSKIMSSACTPGPLRLGQDALEEVGDFVYLGSCISPDGSLDKEIDRRIGRASGAMRCFRSALWNKDAVSRKTKERVFLASVRSVLLYGCEAWGLTKERQNRLNGFEYNSLRSIARLPPQQHIARPDLYNLFHLRETAADFVERRRLTWLGHCLRMERQRIPRQLLDYHVPRRNWRRPRGRPRMTWKRLVHSDTYHLTNIIRHQRGSAASWTPAGHEWMTFLGEIAAERSQWKQVMKSICQDVDQ